MKETPDFVFQASRLTLWRSLRISSKFHTSPYKTIPHLTIRKSPNVSQIPRLPHFNLRESLRIFFKSHTLVLPFSWHFSITWHFSVEWHFFFTFFHDILSHRKGIKYQKCGASSIGWGVRFGKILRLAYTHYSLTLSPTHLLSHWIVAMKNGTLLLYRAGTVWKRGILVLIGLQLSL